MKIGILRFVITLGLLLLTATQPVLAWGVDGHQMINRLAGLNLPADIPEFLRSAQAIDALSYYSPLPDHWRGSGEPALKTASAPEHFLNMETLDVLHSLPRDRYDYVRALAVAQAAHPELTLSAEKIGMQPYQTVEVWERLKVAMRDYREVVARKEPVGPAESEVIFLAGWLGHYVGDGSMPLHTSDKPNGWVGPNPAGYTTEHHIHSLFESEFVSMNVKLADVAPVVTKEPLLIGDVFDQYMEYLTNSHKLVEKTYQLEKAGAFTGAGTPEAKAFAVGQLAVAATELRNLIYTAWVRSGAPVPQRPATR